MGRRGTAAWDSCIAISSGFLFALAENGGRGGAHEPVLHALPVRVFFFAIGGMALLFVLTWWLDTYYVPMLHHGCCRP